MHWVLCTQALLVFHSPVDTVVDIRQAEKIYLRAKHPKSFVSLGDADHLLSRKQDAEYVAATIATWASRLTGSPPVVKQRQSGVTRGELVIGEHNHDFTRSIVTDHHFWLADEPVDAGGANLGPDPYEHLLAALGSCTSMTIRMYANHKELPLEDVSVALSYSRQHGEDCRHCDENDTQIGVLSRTISLKGDLTEAQRARLLQIADRCPVHKTLEGKVVIETREAAPA